jgi:hypothetical protein
MTNAPEFLDCYRLDSCSCVRFHVRDCHLICSPDTLAVIFYQDIRGSPLGNVPVFFVWLPKQQSTFWETVLLENTPDALNLFMLLSRGEIQNLCTSSLPGGQSTNCVANGNVGGEVAHRFLVLLDLSDDFITVVANTTAMHDNRPLGKDQDSHAVAITLSSCRCRPCMVFRGGEEPSVTGLGSVCSYSYLGWYSAARTVSSCHGNSDILPDRFGYLRNIFRRESWAE